MQTTQWLNIRQAAARIGRPVSALRDWRRKGRGPRGFIIEGRLTYTTADIDQWMAEQVQQPGPGTDPTDATTDE